MRFFKSLIKQVDKPDPFIQTINIAYGQIILRFDKTTGETEMVDFNTPLIIDGKYPKCWVADEYIGNDFNVLIDDKIPYSSPEERVRYITDMQKFRGIVSNFFSKGKFNHKPGFQILVDHFLKVVGFDYGVKILNVFMECTVQWLTLQENKFKELTEREPEFMLSDEEYERIVKSMVRFSNPPVKFNPIKGS